MTQRTHDVRHKSWTLLSSAHRFGAIVLAILSTWLGSPFSLAQSSGIRTSTIQLTLKSKSTCPSNLVLLSDVVTLSGSDAVIQQLEEIPIGPAPRLGQNQSISRASIEKSLTLREICQRIDSLERLQRMRGRTRRRSSHDQSEDRNEHTQAGCPTSELPLSIRPACSTQPR